MNAPARKQVLFYTDAVSYLRSIFNPADWEYLDDFPGDLIIMRKPRLLLVVEIKSEKEIATLSSTNGKAFGRLRNKINSISFFAKRGNGKYKGWLAILAQPWDYLINSLPACIANITFQEQRIALAVPLDKVDDLYTAVSMVQAGLAGVPALHACRLEKPKDNIAILMYEAAELTAFFQSIETGEQSPAHLQNDPRERKPF